LSAGLIRAAFNEWKLTVKRLTAYAAAMAERNSQRLQLRPSGKSVQPLIMTYNENRGGKDDEMVTSNAKLFVQYRYDIGKRLPPILADSDFLGALLGGVSRQSI